MWDEVPLRDEPARAPTRVGLVRFAVAVTVGAAIWWLGHPVIAVALVVGVGIVTQVSLVWPAFERVPERFGEAIGTVLSFVATVIAQLVLVPASAVQWLLRRDPLEPAGRRPEGSTWRLRGVELDPTRAPFTVEAATGLSRRPGWFRALVPPLVGWLVILVAADFGLGWAWDRAMAAGDGPALAPGAATQTAPGQEQPPDTRVNSPGFEGVPWAAEYLEESNSMNHEFVPYIVADFTENRGRFINTVRDTRVSYVPEGLPEDAPTIWFFGGSTMFGEGQRDMHTIPSEVARLAEADGVPVRVLNFGHQGDVNWQEMLRFERALAHREPPEIAVFYSGTNEVQVQREQRSEDPTHYEYDDIKQAVAEGGDFDLVTPFTLRGLYDRYAEHSLVHEVVDGVGDLFSTAPAQAQTETDPVVDPEDFPEIADNAVSVYRRGRRIQDFLAEQHGVEPVFYWQPVTLGQIDYEMATEQIDPPTIDISDILDDHQDVFIDGGHHNEEGARIVAERMWQDLEPMVRELVGER